MFLIAFPAPRQGRFSSYLMLAMALNLAILSVCGEITNKDWLLILWPEFLGLCDEKA